MLRNFSRSILVKPILTGTFRCLASASAVIVAVVAATVRTVESVATAEEDDNQ